MEAIRPLEAFPAMVRQEPPVPQLCVTPSPTYSTSPLPVACLLLDAILHLLDRVARYMPALKRYPILSCLLPGKQSSSASCKGGYDSASAQAGHCLPPAPLKQPLCQANNTPRCRTTLYRSPTPSLLSGPPHLRLRFLPPP